ncbi:carboxypeptidase-like regulatory domain-containing protein [Thermophagus sp. OGC60D27]|uniref:carboxypeptidase-like regulatory domain-containing protein n=1 Tax=Thermophagus sp. OGC60D27 TaxID=3458415 RepID=UPI004037AC36
MKKESFFKMGLGIFVFMLLAGTVAAQQIEVTGAVTDAHNGEPIPGVSVVQKNTMNGSITDSEGIYRIRVDRGSTIVFSFVGFIPEEIVVEAAGTYNVALRAAVFDVDEVVVTALGISRQKKSLGYTVS